MNKKMKIVILTLDAGFGHRRAATALSDAFQSKYGDEVECKIINPVREDGLSSIIQKSQNQYDSTSTKHRGAYGTAFKSLNHYPVSYFAEQIVTPFCIKEVTQTLIDESPDGVITTFPIFYTSVSRMLSLMHVRIPFYSVVTDLDDVHKIWFDPGPGKYFVASQELKYQAISCGIQAQKVTVSGIPVDIRIALEKREKTEVRKNLGWDLELPTILAVGSKRVNHLFEKMVSIDESGVPLQLCIVAGGDDALFKAVIARTWKNRVHCYNYMNNIPELMHAADILVTKAGGLITSEGLASGLPMIIVDSIDGQETGNVKFLRENDAAVVADSNDDLKAIVSEWLAKDEGKLVHYAKNAKQLGKAHAAFTIAENMFNDIHENRFGNKNSSTWTVMQFISNQLT